MSRQNPTFETLRALFARPGSRCAFPGCVNLLVNEKNMFVGQVCHIEAASTNGPRYNSSQVEQERRASDNLILLCYPHHVEVDREPATYTVDHLRALKRLHENAIRHPYQIDDTLLRKIVSEIEDYWRQVEQANKFEHPAPEFAVRIDTKASFLALADSVASALQYLMRCLDDLRQSDEGLDQQIRNHLSSLGYDTTQYDTVPYWKNPFYLRHWESHNLSVRNHFTDLSMLLMQMEIKYLEEHLIVYPADSEARDRLSQRKVEFRDLAKAAGYTA